ncbi:hypothetical protein HanRHA438_Chr03g0105541 [Helianthus annuus]|nr:hypothetical protein HanIR_Chr03g0103001 [Helianthus annuus]KAJ0934273.1 hypothetical protein HanRHA438_Chr03g0105541 [Helianthus annuus]KAJ0942337.1 hypothetical protein HanPSC8_Chr03g0090781 [Helianthus annuus]
MGVWRKGVVVGRSSDVRRRRKKAALVVITGIENRKSTERKLRQLERIVPGGGVGPTDIDTLFHRIAAHIFVLETRVDLLKNIYSVFCPP